MSAHHQIHKFSSQGFYSRSWISPNLLFLSHYSLSSFNMVKVTMDNVWAKPSSSSYFSVALRKGSHVFWAFVLTPMKWRCWYFPISALQGLNKIWYMYDICRVTQFGKHNYLLTSTRYLLFTFLIQIPYICHIHWPNGISTHFLSTYQILLDFFFFKYFY